MYYEMIKPLPVMLGKVLGYPIRVSLAVHQNINHPSPSCWARWGKPIRGAWQCTQHNQQGGDHSLTLQSGLADSTIFLENACSREILVTIMSI